MRHGKPGSSSTVLGTLCKYHGNSREDKARVITEGHKESRTFEENGDQEKYRPGRRKDEDVKAALSVG